MISNVPCITCQVNLRDTLRPLPRKNGFCFCTRCEACYVHVVGQDMLGKSVDYLDPVKPGRGEWPRAIDDGVNYETPQDYAENPYHGAVDSTMPQEYVHDHVMSVPPPQLEYIELPNFEEEREIIKKSKTVKEFLKNSLYLEKPYDK